MSSADLWNVSDPHLKISFKLAIGKVVTYYSPIHASFGNNLERTGSGIMGLLTNGDFKMALILGECHLVRVVDWFF